ncbi:MAG TPA: chloride channel protein [Thermomicrobiales bacterium]|nr:chloride channel protein [Thermomicrobiales bacterium]
MDQTVESLTPATLATPDGARDRVPLPHHLRDFTATTRMLVISGLAVVIGAAGALLAWALLRLIAFFTNVFYYQRWSFDHVSPADNTLGWLAIFVPIIGGLILGIMARFGSERIRGHGIPEAIEAIMINGSRIGPRVAVLKPVSSAISIGSGGPFGAEGPIIMTGGAVGSLIAQFFRLTSSERKTLMVAGAAAGMAAVFSAPIAALGLAVELLLFEFKPRSLFPVAIASMIAATLRIPLLGGGPIFPVPAHHIDFGATPFLFCVLAGLAAGILALVITRMVYAAEDAFALLPVHWMWWPAIGGIAIGIGGLIFPEALGVGYDVIAELLTGEASMRIIVGVLIVKSIIWAIPLGAGTSGGVLAPMLMMGAALGALESHIFPDYGAGFWAMVGMAAILGGTMRVPFTALLFTVELTHDVEMLLPLMVATVVAYGTTVLFMSRSILTEKISRRGFHITREYSVDPLEVLSVQEVMRTQIVALPQALPSAALEKIADGVDQPRGQHLYPVLDEAGELVAVVTRRELRARLHDPDFANAERPLELLMRPDPVVAHPAEPLRIVAARMAETGLTAFPVVERDAPGNLLGMIGLPDLLRARERQLSDERHRQRWIRIRLFRGESSPELQAAD